MKDEKIETITDLIHLAGMLLQAGNNLAAELEVCTAAAREAGCELQEAELYLIEWNALINHSQESIQ